MSQIFTDEQLQTLLDQGLSNMECGRQLGVDESSIRKRKKKWALNGDIPEGYVVKGNSILYDANGEIKQQWVKTTQTKEDAKEELKELIKVWASELPKVTPQTVYNEHTINENILSVYPLGDPHIGMLAWEDECGESWDLKIAEKVFIDIFDRVVKVAPRSKECLIINLGDFFHYDNMEGTTSRSGNRLDVDGRYAKMVQVGVKIIRRMIESALEHHDIVNVINVIGNHDDVGSLFLSVCLKNVYENEPRVIIHDRPSPFHYYQFGKVLIGTHHGHTCKMDKLPGVMAADMPNEWGTSRFRYWLTGHIHHDSKKEYPGCMVESFRTVAAKDAYATYGGWRSGRDTKAIVYHKEWGEIERHTINIAQVTD